MTGMENGIGRGRLWFLSLVAAMGGFLFGYDTAVINGAEQQIQSGWGLSGLVHGWVMSAALWGTVAGALCGGKVTDRFGRKRKEPGAERNREGVNRSRKRRRYKPRHHR